MKYQDRKSFEAFPPKVRSFESCDLIYPDIYQFTHDSSMVVRSAKNEFEHPQIVEFYSKDGPAVLMESTMHDRLTDGGRFMIEQTKFAEVSEWAQGREDSLHGVMFGNLSLVNSENKVFETAVAIKPFQTWRRGAANELGAMIKATELTGIQSFEPICIINDGRLMYLVTRFDSTVASLDNLDWNQSLEESLEDSLDIVESLQKCALTLARLHTSGIIHNDAQVKNMAISDDGNTRQIRLIDLESSKWRDTDDVVDRQKFLNGVHSDAGALIDSILKRGLWTDAGYDTKARAIEAMFTEPYLSYMRHPANDSAELLDEIQDIIDVILNDI